MLADLTFYLAAIPAVIILGLAKGGLSGLGMLATPLMALTVPPVQAASIILPILLVQDVVGVWLFRVACERTLCGLCVLCERSFFSSSSCPLRSLRSLREILVRSRSYLCEL